VQAQSSRLLRERIARFRGMTFRRATPKKRPITGPIVPSMLLKSQFAQRDQVLAKDSLIFYVTDVDALWKDRASSFVPPASQVSHALSVLTHSG
jgi:hypothetical protein